MRRKGRRSFDTAPRYDTAATMATQETCSNSPQNWEGTVEISFAPWLAPVLLTLGIFMLFKAKGVGLKVVGGALTFIGGILLLLQIWIYTRHFRN